MNTIDIKEKKILVIGDIMLDTYYIGNVKRISPEAPVPVFNKKNERSVLGGAGNVASNLIAASQKVAILSTIGNDENGRYVMSLFNRQSIDTNLIYINERQTTTKVRFLAENNQQLLRLDIEDIVNINGEEYLSLLSKYNEHIKDYDLILMSDYMKGLLTQSFSKKIIECANNNNIPIIIDVKDPNYEKYKGATLIKPNLNELRMLTGCEANTDEEIINASEKLRELCNCKYVLTTLGSKGMVLVGDGTPYFVKSLAKEVYDVSGAGDTTIAYLAACIANGVNIRDAVDIANYAAGIQVSKVGTSSVSWKEVLDSMATKICSIRKKIISKDDILNFRIKNSDKRIVFTNGCFDILHIGHKKYLEKASTLGDILVVGVNSDSSVRRLKGYSRPINNEQDRIEMLSAFSFIDYVVIFEEDTPYELIRSLQPDVLVKGGDYSREEVIGKDIVEARGGTLELIPFVEGKSTTNIIDKIKGYDK